MDGVGGQQPQDGIVSIGQGKEIVAKPVLLSGAGFFIPITGDMMRMPGLPKEPQAMHIDLVDGKVVGLS